MGLFKDSISKTDYEKRINDLMRALNEGENGIKQLLLGTTEPDTYSNHGKYVNGQHNRCDGLKEEKFTEKRLCKCLYYYNRPYKKVCDKCDMS